MYLLLTLPRMRHTQVTLTRTVPVIELWDVIGFKNWEETITVNEDTTLREIYRKVWSIFVIDWDKFMWQGIATGKEIDFSKAV